MSKANEVVEKLIKDCHKKNINKLILVTGKGLHSENDQNPYISKDLGILKNSVPDYIRNNDELMTIINRIETASIEDGGSGAIYIFLKKNL